MILESIGEIAKMDIPAGWQEKLIVTPTLSTKSVRCFVAPDAEACQIRFISNAARQHQNVASRFAAMLAGGERALNNIDVADLTPIVGDMADDQQFQLLCAQATKLHQRPVLWVEGKWLNGNYWAGSMFLAANETAEFIQEIGCLCDFSEEAKRKPLFWQAFDSIKWKL